MNITQSGKTLIKSAVTVTAFIAICAIAMLATPRGDEALHWYSIVPPLLAVSLAMLTNRVIPSLGIAVLAGGFLATVPGNASSLSAWAAGMGKGISFVYGSAVDDVNLQILLFVIFVIAMIGLMVTSGGIQVIINGLMRFATGWRSTQFVTALMGVVIFFDDYANTMIVGNSLRPLTDKRRVSREKLAFLVDATSAPIAGIAAISTWIGYEVGLFGEVSKSLGLGMDGYSMFFDALGFRFYCLLMLVFIFANTISGQDFGPMKKAQKRALETGQVFAPDAKPLSRNDENTSPHPTAAIRATTAIVPILTLFVTLFGGIWIDGGGTRLDASALFSLSSWRQVMGAGENTTQILAGSALVGLVAAIVCSLTSARLSPRIIGRSVLAGAKTSLLPMVILVLAWSLKAGCDELSTGKFLAGTISQVVSPLWFPFLLFLVAGMTSFATGTSWGTMAILIPTAIPVAYQLDGANYGITTMICLGAVLDGAIFGDHCSPISDTTIMSSAASGCDHIHHVSTQFPYSVTVAIIAGAFGYLPAAMGVPPWMGLGMGAVLICGLFWFLSVREKGGAGLLSVSRFAPSES